MSYTNLPDQYYKGFLPNDTLKVKARISGYQILKNKMDPPHFILDIQKNGLIKSHQWQPPAFKNQIKQLFGNHISIIDIWPQTVKFNVKAVHQKKVPVVPDVDLSFKPGFAPKSKALIEPANVWVYGKQDILDTLQFVTTRHYDIKNIGKNVSKKLTIKKIDGLKYNKEVVLYKMPVSEIVENRIMLPVVVSGKPANVNLLLFPDKIKLKYKFFKNDFEAIDTNAFRLKVQYDLSKKHWKVKLDKHPKDIFEVQIIPNQVNYLIKQSND